MIIELELNDYKCDSCKNEFSLSDVYASVKYCPYCGVDKSGFDLVESDNPYDYI